MKNKLYTLTWISALITVILLTYFYKGKATIFYGIAESNEIAINYERAVEVKKIYVVQGQLINIGDTIVQLNRPDLNLKINELTNNLNELKAKGHINIGEAQSQIHQLQAEQATITNEINTKINQLEAQYKLNKELTSGLKSIGNNHESPEKSSSSNPLQLKIKDLQNELRLALSPNQIKIDLLKQTLAGTANPTKIQIENLEKELNLALKEKERLMVFSTLNGVIGTVNYKEGENASPFTNILTVHAKSPSFIKGYIHEDIYSQVEINQEVNINSIANPKHKISGKVVGIGSRIVEFPVRLRKRSDMLIWGREVLLKIPAENEFLLGEKVIITPVIDLGLKARN